MKLLLFMLLALATSGFAAETSHLAKMIACEPKEEILITRTYEAFLTLVSKREVKKEDLIFPVRLAIRKDDGVIITRSFHISPNELRGFELFIPNDCVTEKDGLLIPTVALVADREETKQGIRCLILKKSPSKH